MPLEITNREAKLTEDGDLRKHAAEIDRDHPRFEGKHLLMLLDPDEITKALIVGPFKHATDIVDYIDEKSIPPGVWSATTMISPEDEEGDAMHWGVQRRPRGLRDPRAKNKLVDELLMSALMGRSPDDMPN